MIRTNVFDPVSSGLEKIFKRRKIWAVGEIRRKEKQLDIEYFFFQGPSAQRPKPNHAIKLQEFIEMLRELKTDTSKTGNYQLAVDLRFVDPNQPDDDQLQDALSEPKDWKTAASTIRLKALVPQAIAKMLQWEQNSRNCYVGGYNLRYVE